MKEDRLLIYRIQAQLRATARRQYDMVRLPPFTCYMNPDEPAPWASYAIPDLPVDGNAEAPLQKLVSWYQQHERMPRLEFIEEYAPQLVAPLERTGFLLEGRNQLMVATAKSIKSPHPVAGLSIVPLDRFPAIDRVRQVISVLERGFGAPEDLYVSHQRAATFWRRFGSTRFFLAVINGEAVGVGSLTPPWNSVAEIAGLATLEKYRRQGIGSALTAHMSAAGFAQGLDVLFLTAGSQRAGRVYQRLGYRAAGVGLAYYFPSEHVENPA